MSKIDLNGLDPAIESDTEKIQRLARLGLSFVPIAGGGLVELFNSIITPPMEKRRDAAIIAIGSALNELLEQKFVTEDELRQNDALINTIVEVCSISLKTHQSEKLEALRNAVRNSALPTCPTDDYRHIFLGYVDHFTVTHIRVLRFAHNPMAWLRRVGSHFPGCKSGEMGDVIDVAIPELRGHEWLRNTIWSDLSNRGLTALGPIGGSRDPQDSLEKLTTKLGDQFIHFISHEPLPV